MRRKVYTDVIVDQRGNFLIIITKWKNVIKYKIS